jgi:hypothetical protein
VEILKYILVTKSEQVDGSMPFFFILLGKRQQIRINHVRVGRRHSLRKAGIHVESRTLEETAGN